MAIAGAKNAAFHQHVTASTEVAAAGGGGNSGNGKGGGGTDWQVEYIKKLNDDLAEVKTDLRELRVEVKTVEDNLRAEINNLRAETIAGQMACAPKSLTCGPLPDVLIWLESA